MDPVQTGSARVKEFSPTSANKIYFSIIKYWKFWILLGVSWELVMAPHFKSYIWDCQGEGFSLSLKFNIYLVYLYILRSYYGHNFTYILINSEIHNILGDNFGWQSSAVFLPEMFFLPSLNRCVLAKTHCTLSKANTK